LGVGEGEHPQPLTQSLTPSLTQSLTPSLTQPFTQPLTSLSHSLTSHTPPVMTMWLISAQVASRARQKADSVGTPTVLDAHNNTAAVNTCQQQLRQAAGGGGKRGGGGGGEGKKRVHISLLVPGFAL